MFSNVSNVFEAKVWTIQATGNISTPLLTYLTRLNNMYVGDFSLPQHMLKRNNIRTRCWHPHSSSYRHYRAREAAGCQYAIPHVVKERSFLFVLRRQSAPTENLTLNFSL